MGAVIVNRMRTLAFLDALITHWHATHNSQRIAKIRWFIKSSTQGSVHNWVHELMTLCDSRIIYERPYGILKKIMVTVEPRIVNNAKCEHMVHLFAPHMSSCKPFLNPHLTTHYACI